MLWLRKKLEWFRWLGMFVILGGLIITGVGETYAPKRCYVINLDHSTDGLANMANMSTHVANMSTHVANMETQMANMSEQVAKMDKHVGNISTQVANKDTRLLPEYSYVTSKEECAQEGSDSHLLVGILLIVAGQVVPILIFNREQEVSKHYI